MIDEAVDYNRVFVVKVFLGAVGDYREVEVFDFGSLDEAVGYMDDWGYLRHAEDSPWLLTFIDNRTPGPEEGA